jgi:hypothetical protein
MAQCAGCGTENIRDARFCRQCGKTMETATEPEAPVQSATARRGGLIVGLVLAGFAAATGVGYFIGIRSVDSPKVEPAAMPESSRASTAQPDAPAVPATAEQPVAKPATTPEKTKHAQAASAKQAIQSSPPASPEPDSPSQNLAKLRQELATCGKYNVFCTEKVRWRHCKDIWGTIPECPQAKPSIPTN